MLSLQKLRMFRQNIYSEFGLQQLKLSNFSSCSTRTLRKRRERQNIKLFDNTHQMPLVNRVTIRFFQSSVVLDGKKAIVKEQKGKHKPKVMLTDDEMLDVIRVDALKNQLDHAINKLKESFIQHLSTRINTSTIETLLVTVEGDEYPLNEVTQILKKNPQLLSLNMANFPEAIKPAIQAIEASGLNVTIQQDGTMLYIHIPRVTREQREIQAKKAKVILNQTKDEIKLIQNRFIKDAKNKKEAFSEDLIFNLQENIKFMADAKIAEGESMLKSKEKELLGE